MNVVAIVCNVFVGLWLAPFLIRSMGVAAYGLVPLAMVFSEYVSIVAQSFNASVNRNLTVSFRQGRVREAVGIFNSSFAVLVALGVVQVIGAVFLAVHLESFVSVPDGLASDACWLFVFTAIGFTVSLISSVFSVSMYSSNRLDLMRMADVLRILTRVGLIVGLFSFGGASLAAVGVANLVASVVVLGFNLFHWKRLTPELVVDFGAVNRPAIKLLWGMGGWMLVNQVGFLLLARVDLWAVNKYLGPDEGGRYALVLQWVLLVRVMAASVTGLFGPVITMYYANNDLTKIRDAVFGGGRALCLALAVPLGMMCGFSADLLAAWVGDEFRDTGGLLALQLAPLVFSLSTLPFMAVKTAFNRVRVPGMVTCALGLLNVGLVVWIATMTEYGVIGVACVGVVVLLAKNLGFQVMYCCSVMDAGSGYYRLLLPGGVVFASVWLGASFVSSMLGGLSLLQLIVAVMVVGGIGWLLVSRLIFQGAYGAWLHEVMPGRVRRLFSKC
ncbi:lipopolysaccharide biosynthesis protein [Sulfuriroseicoccus oceanibius]|uniref:Polysaccharide biosynthesis protein n=1 Tax=Sulfuriroseicoccus oceanibius TaxID=2707525 RepID=A0A6B3LA59_9BACT|nr:hypothetical protein [Sulfuriroseicoccus oceanibius]QQL45621.1 hypothetical protein G3M56_003260 [Sulfuriroseicoccus oceanibius]